mmetsp:Transcript_19892/g.24116  ORF Transcript_19892/g.24116 Transcript_19892/m.24116 type:complete len:88 (-) Transcript_19892:96-359(-)
MKGFLQRKEIVNIKLNLQKCGKVGNQFPMLQVITLHTFATSNQRLQILFHKQNITHHSHEDVHELWGSVFHQLPSISHPDQVWFRKQ